jgi:small-conductance mechanosensitive channel
MKHDLLKQYAALHKSLVEEKANLESRLAEINAALGAADALPAAPASAPVPVASGKTRTMSAAGRARIIAAQKARWAKYNAEHRTAFKKVKRTKRTMSPEAKAKIAAAQKKRWAKFHAAQGK